MILPLLHRKKMKTTRYKFPHIPCILFCAEAGDTNMKNTLSGASHLLSFGDVFGH